MGSIEEIRSKVVLEIRKEREGDEMRGEIRTKCIPLDSENPREQKGVS